MSKDLTADILSNFQTRLNSWAKPVREIEWGHWTLDFMTFWFKRWRTEKETEKNIWRRKRRKVFGEGKHLLVVKKNRDGNILHIHPILHILHMLHILHSLHILYVLLLSFFHILHFCIFCIICIFCTFCIFCIFCKFCIFCIFCGRGRVKILGANFLSTRWFF